MQALLHILYLSPQPLDNWGNEFQEIGISPEGKDWDPGTTGWEGMERYDDFYERVFTTYQTGSQDRLAVDSAMSMMGKTKSWLELLSYAYFLSSA